MSNVDLCSTLSWKTSDVLDTLILGKQERFQWLSEGVYRALRITKVIRQWVPDSRAGYRKRSIAARTLTETMTQHRKLVTAGRMQTLSENDVRDWRAAVCQVPRCLVVLAFVQTEKSKTNKNWCVVDVVHCRLYLVNSPVVRADNLRFKEEGVRDVVKDVFLPWYNAYRFLVQNVQRLQRVSNTVTQKWLLL